MFPSSSRCAGLFERDPRRPNARFGDVPPQDIVEVNPLRRVEQLDRPDVVVDEVRPPAVCMSEAVGQTSVLRKGTVMRWKASWAVLIQKAFVSMRKAFPRMA